MDIKTYSEKDMEFYDIAYLIQKYDTIKNSAASYALVHLNIKNFRYYHTKFGFTARLEILRLIFHHIAATLEKEEYIAHLSTDNFVFLVQYKDITYLVHERLVSLVDQLYRIQDERIYRNIFFSIGVYCIIDYTVKFFDALNYANLCRKECKTIFQRNSNIEIYDENFYNQYMNRMELECKTAEAYKNYEFTNYYQPKVDLKTEKIVGAEALIRWFDKDGTSIPLHKFLPILNENGYIALLDIDTFEQTCDYLDKRVKNHKKVVPISFNISKAYFYDPNIVQDYIKVFEKFELPKELIQIEFMESISLNDTKRIKEVVSGFKEYGFTCSLDDFGNGYSSFQVLLNTQLDIVKMDRQFFLNNLNGDSKLIIKTIVDLIHSLKMKVVAEGVEQKEHIECLKNCHCDYVQGYYYYKPMSIEEFSALLDSQSDFLSEV